MRGQRGPCQSDAFSYFDVHYQGTGCNGSRLAACVRGGLAELECGLFGAGFSCQSSGGSFFCGTGSECDPATDEKSCEATNVVFCNAGTLVLVDCAELGFAACSANPRLGCE